MEYIVQNVNTGAWVAVFASGEAEARASAYALHPAWFGCWIQVRRKAMGAMSEEELSDAADDLADWGDGW